MEVSSLVFGVIPLVLEAVKNYRKVCNTLHTFRHYSREVRRIEKQFNVCRQIFLNECNLLLQIVAGENYARDMLADATHDFWRRAQLEEDLNKSLSDGYEACKIIITETRDMLGLLEENLSSFDVLARHKQRLQVPASDNYAKWFGVFSNLTSHPFPTLWFAQKLIALDPQHEKLKSAIYRVRDSVKIAFDKSTYDANLSKLRERNSDLIALRSQIREFQKNRKDLARSSAKALPGHYESIHSASKTLHEALSGAWNCPYLGHKTHFGKLCIEAHAQNAVRLDMALSHNLLSENDTQRRNRGSDHTWIYVQSVKLDGTVISNQHGTFEATATSKELSTALQTIQQDSRDALMAGRSSLQDVLGYNRPSKRRKVESIDKTTTPSDQMNQIQDLCQEIEKTVCSHEMLEPGQCLGYLESPRLFKHIFYANQREPVRDSQGIVNLKALLQSTEKMPAAIDPASKFKIAHKMATAVLQYHSTSWLKNDWRLKDIAYFGDFQRPTEESLRTLHLTFFFSQDGEGQETETAHFNPDLATGLSLKSQEEDIQLQYGINNPVLFSLGVALLEMACHQSLEVMDAAQNPIVVARKLAASVRPLGSRYQRIVQQCLQCDFGQGSDLTKSELQNAIYGAVICPLDEMIKSLSMV